MKRLLVLMAAPLLFAAGCSSSSGTPAAGPATSATTTAPATDGAGSAADPGGTTGAGTSTGSGAGAGTSTGSGTGTGAGTGSGGASPAKQASTSRCHTGDLKLSLGEGDGAAGTGYTPLIFKNVSGRTCTLYGFPGVSWVAGNDGQQVNGGFTRTDAAKDTITLTAGGVAHATLATHDVGFYDAAQCKPVSVRGLRVYPPDETKSIFVPLATKACSVSGVNLGTVSPIAKGAAF